MRRESLLRRETLTRLYGHDWQQQLKDLEESEPGAETGVDQPSGAPPTGNPAAVVTGSPVGGAHMTSGQAGGAEGGSIPPPPPPVAPRIRATPTGTDQTQLALYTVQGDEVASEFSQGSWADYSNEDLVNMILVMFDPQVETIAEFEAKVIRAVAVLESREADIPWVEVHRSAYRSRLMAEIHPMSPEEQCRALRRRLASILEEGLEGPEPELQTQVLIELLRSRTSDQSGASQSVVLHAMYTQSGSKSASEANGGRGTDSRTSPQQPGKENSPGGLGDEVTPEKAGAVKGDAISKELRFEPDAPGRVDAGRDADDNCSHAGSQSWVNALSEQQESLRAQSAAILKLAEAMSSGNKLSLIHI